MQKKEIIQLQITGILCVVLLFAAMNSLKVKKRATLLLTKKKISQANTTKEKNERLFSKLEEEAKNLELKRDPFFAQPVVSAKETSTHLSLNGIVWDEVHPTAIINNTIVRKGSVIEGNTVVDIQKDKVILSDGHRNFELDTGL